MTKRTFTVRHAVGLHARPAAKFVKIAKGFDSVIFARNVTRKGEMVDAKSLVKVIKIAVAQHQEVEVSADGQDEQEAVEALTIFFRDVPEGER